MLTTSQISRMITDKKIWIQDCRDFAPVFVFKNDQFHFNSSVFIRVYPCNPWLKIFIPERKLNHR